MRADGGNESPFHVASVLGISIQDWDILAPHSGLFYVRGRIQSIMWWCNLKLEVELNEFKT